jgi:hypothetical protein
MLDMDMVSAVLAEALQEHIGLLRSFQRVDQRVFAAGEIILLNVNNDQSSLHLISSRYHLHFQSIAQNDVAAVRMNDTVFFLPASLES